MTHLTERCKDLVASAMKDGIYQAFVEVLAEHGTEGLTMDRVAEVAGIAKGSLYNYFQNKQELVRFVFDRSVEPARQALEEILVKPVPAVEKLRSVFQVMLENFATQRGIFEFLFMDPATKASLDSPERTGRVDVISKFQRILQQGVEEGAFRPIDVARSAEMFFGAVVAMIEQQVFLSEERPVDESVRTLTDVFLHGLAPRH